LLTKISVRVWSWENLEDFIDDSDTSNLTHTNALLINNEPKIWYQWIVNFEKLKENKKSFTAPDWITPYLFAYSEWQITKDNGEQEWYSFMQLATTLEKTNTTKLVWHYFKYKEWDSPSLFKTWSWLYLINWEKANWVTSEEETTPTNCVANTNYVKDWKTFNVPQLNHWIKANPNPYVELEENNGTYRYELEVTCTDWSLDEIISKTLQWCKGWYYQDDTNCIEVWIWYYSPEWTKEKIECPAWSYCEEWETTPKSCSVNTYSEAWAWICTSCPTNSTTNGFTGQTSLSACLWIAGYYNCEDGTCNAVETWYYSPANSNVRTACTNKPSNSSYTWNWWWSNSCSWSCDDWYSKSENSCIASIPENEIGYP
jgi:hypothetical protein